MKLSKSGGLATAIRFALAAGALVATSTAFAQDTSSAKADNPDIKSLETVSVTGSRIRSVDVETAQPVITLTQADIQKTGLTSVGDILQNLTIAGSPTFSKAAVLSSNTEEGGQYINMYNLGEQRVLVLVNGKRWMSILAGLTDMSTIPASLIDHIEILKDGASAVYGSDAISGVVNIILKDHYKGISFDGSYGQNEDHGDGRQQAYSVTFGSSNEKSSIVFAATYNKTDPVWAATRALTAYPEGPNHPTAGLSGNSPWARFMAADPSTATLKGTWIINHTGSWNGVGDTQDPTKTTSYHKGVTVDDRFDTALQMMEQLPTELKSVFSQGSYNLTDNITFKATGMYAERDSSTQIAGYPLSSTSSVNALTGMGPIYISGQSYYNPVPGQDEWFNRRIIETPRVASESAKSLHFDTGLEGYFQLGSYTWNWDVGFDYNKYDVDTLQTGDINYINLANSLGPSFMNSAGVVQCGTPVDPVPLGGCVPFNILGGTTTSTQAALNYINAIEHSQMQSLTRDYTANITGGIAEIQGGTISVAAGVEHRSVSGFDHPDAMILNGFSSTPSRLPTDGHYNTNEAYFEFNLPLLKDLAWAKELSLDYATRYSHYSNFGDTTNDKISVQYAPFEDLKFRGTYAHGFRAPTLDDSFGGGTQTFDAYTDPCDVNFGATSKAVVAHNCQAAGLPGNFHQLDSAGTPVTARETQSVTPFNAGAGNLYLEPEHSTSRTLGAIYSPSYAEGLNFTLDYYKFNITNVITAITADYVLNQCYVYSIENYCKLFSRDANGQVVNLSRGNANLGSLTTAGYNFGVHYRLPKFSFGQFMVSLDANYTSYYDVVSEPGTPAVDYVGQYGFNHIRANLGVDWQLKNWGATWGIRYYGAFRDYCLNDYECNEPNYNSSNWPNGVGANRKGAIVYNDVQLRYQLPWNGNLAVGARDIFDKHPPITYSVDNNSASSVDPNLDLGRYIYIQYSQKF